MNPKLHCGCSPNAIKVFIRIGKATTGNYKTIERAGLRAAMEWWRQEGLLPFSFLVLVDAETGGTADRRVREESRGAEIEPITAMDAAIGMRAEREREDRLRIVDWSELDANSTTKFGLSSPLLLWAVISGLQSN